MTKKNRVTIRDVAQAAGVSISTVSKALNSLDGVSPETRVEIQNIASRLNYVPNLMGKQLKSGKTKMIGVYTNRISGPYFNSLIDEIAFESKLHGYGLNVIVSDERDVIMSSLLGNFVDGAIVVEDVLNQKDIETINSNGVATVFINRIVADKKVGSVAFDSFEKGYLAGNYLLNLGHKKIGYVNGVDDIYDNDQRFQGFKAALSKVGLTYNEDFTIAGNFVEEDAYANTLAFIDNQPAELPSAFLAANDMSAVGLIKALTEKNYSVPEDFSVVGFDDVEVLKYFKPSLTTIHNSTKEQGKKAIEHLLEMMGGKSVGRVIEVKGTLMIRETAIEYTGEWLSMYVGIDVGGTSIKYGLVDSKGNIMAKDTLVTSFEKEELLQNLADIVEKYVSSSPETIEGVGISMPGIVQEDGFLLTAGAIRSCYGINLKEEMEKRTGILTKEVIDSNGANLDWEN